MKLQHYTVIQMKEYTYETCLIVSLQTAIVYHIVWTQEQIDLFIIQKRLSLPLKCILEV